MTTLHKAAREALEALNAMLTHMGMDEDEWNKPTFNQARAALATLRAALDEAPGEEREAFEAWYASDMDRQLGRPGYIKPSDIAKLRDGEGYGERRLVLNWQWTAWHARAMLAARPSGPKGEPAAWLCEYRSGEEFVSMAKDPMRDPDVMSAVPLYAARPEAPQGEPVAWVRRHPDGTLTRELLHHSLIEPVRQTCGAWVPLYAARTSAPTMAQKPLTRQQIDAVMTEHYPLSSLMREEVDAFEACVRDIERLHGIGKEGGA